LTKCNSEYTYNDSLISIANTTQRDDDIGI